VPILGIGLLLEAALCVCATAPGVLRPRNRSDVYREVSLQFQEVDCPEINGIHYTSGARVLEIGRWNVFAYLQVVECAPLHGWTYEGWYVRLPFGRWQPTLPAVFPKTIS
jgi:hypothetical protein